MVEVLRGSLSIGLGMLVCSRNVRYKGVPSPWSYDCSIVQSRRSSTGLDGTHQRQKYSKASCFNVRIQRARKEVHKTKKAQHFLMSADTGPQPFNV